jgi:hypothetical protein
MSLRYKPGTPLLLNFLVILNHYGKYGYFYTQKFISKLIFQKRYYCNQVKLNF